MKRVGTGRQSDTPARIAVDQAKLRHELRTPLNHIIGYSELLLDEAREQKLDAMIRDLENIRSAGSQLLELINTFLDPEQARPANVEETSGGPDLVDPPPNLEQQGREEGIDEVSAGDDSRGRILVVDDDENNRDILARRLRREGYGVYTAENGALALELVEERPVDLVLLDVMMPVMDGIETCSRLKRNAETRLIPVVIMTALGQVEHRIRGIRAGADDFLTKPVARDELFARIETSLALKQTVDAKLERFKGTQEYLAKFVPQSVLRRLEEAPDAPVIDRTDQDMSALFVDVSGYTKLSEEMRQTADFMIEKYFSRFLDVIHGHGGDVTETSGDGLMVVFPGGDPVEHAVNAVAAAIDILNTTRELNRQLTGIFDPISVHVGINSGIALIGPTKYEGTSGARWTYTALGPAVNLAARIAGVAEEDMICIGPETERRLDGRFVTRELGTKRLKNVSDEVMVHQVVASGAEGDPW